MYSKRISLNIFIIGVAVVWAVILSAARVLGSGAPFHTLALVRSGYCSA
jgi:hypothetical protein